MQSEHKHLVFGAIGSGKTSSIADLVGSLLDRDPVVEIVTEMRLSGPVGSRGWRRHLRRMKASRK